MQLIRMFSTDHYKGTKNYINSQHKYEILRTLIYFSISLSLFIAGIITTKTRMNLLTVVAILGCLPACKSTVEMILYAKFKSCSSQYTEEIDSHMQDLNGLYDMVFTSYNQNYCISHMVIKGNTICGFSETKNFPEQDFYKHLDGILKAENYQNVSIKIYTDFSKYLERLINLNALDTDETPTNGIINTLKSVSL